MGEWLLSRTDRLIVARHEVPGKRPPREPSRRVRYDRAQYPRHPRGIRHSNHRIGAHACANQTVPYGTALLGGAVPGTSCQATIAPSLRDKSHSPIEALRKLGPKNHGRFSGAARRTNMSSFSPTFSSPPESKLNSPFSIRRLLSC
jgi:hypothetical protein